MAKPGYMHLGEVPEEIFQQELLKYLQRKEEALTLNELKLSLVMKVKLHFFKEVVHLQATRLNTLVNV